VTATGPEREVLSGDLLADEARLDDPDALAQGDPGRMLRATAAAGPQIREAMQLASETDLARLGEEGRPRALVIAGVGTAARTGEVLAAVAGPRSPVPVLAHRSPGVPGWVGAADVVVAVSASGHSPEALAAAEAAARRGARLVAVGAPGTPLQSVAETARAPFIPVPRRAPARASLWGLVVPVVLAGRALGLIKVAEADLVETAARLDDDAERCRESAESFVNPAKSLALDLAGSVPVVWGSSPLAAVAAGRFADLLSTNARYPAIEGSLGEVGRGRIGLLDGVFGGLTEKGRDIFADRTTGEPTRMHLVLLRDGGLTVENEDNGEPVAVEERRAEAVAALARRRGIRCTVLTAAGGSPLERLASLVAVPDFASIYLALAHGLDPMAVPAVSELKTALTP
jgi:fructoselysine-6-P-deglycase FrlB-like protein